MRARDAMIVWTPNKELYDNLPNKGQIAVTTIPEPNELKAHPMSVGACDHDWRETDDAGRRELMQRYFTSMIHRDNMDEDSVRNALSEIEDFQGHYFSSDEPTDDEE